MAVFCEHLFSPCSAGSIEIPKLPLQDCHMLFMTKSLGATGKDAPKGGRDGCKMLLASSRPRLVKSKVADMGNVVRMWEYSTTHHLYNKFVAIRTSFSFCPQSIPPCAAQGILYDGYDCRH